MITAQIRRARINEARERLGDEVVDICDDEDLSPLELVALLAYLTGAAAAEVSCDDATTGDVMHTVWQNISAGNRGDAMATDGRAN